ncbi:hypothetical protein M3Y96_01155100 [Aphelenchoides besseyi]|nr:hypothetical protein M3Y96_01155100 [Aphelenchoides besseyi]
MLKFGFSWGVFLTFVFISEYVSAMESDSCFKKEDENWGVWNGNCTGSEVLVVPTQELNVTVDGMHVNKLAQNLTYSFGGCSMTVWYQPQAGSFTYNSIAVGFPLDITITPNQITLKSSTVSKVDCSSTPVQFEKISGGNKIEINYKPENASEAYFKMKYETTDIAWILFIVGLVLFVLLLMSVIVLVVILVRLKNAEKKLDEQQPIETPINESKFSTAVGNEDMKTTPTTGGTGDTKITATLINTAEPNKAHPRTVETTIKSADLRTAEPKNSVEKMALKPRAMILDEKAKYIGQGHKVNQI